MIKDILVVLDDVGERTGPFAMSVARMFGAHATVLGTAPDLASESIAMAEFRYDLILDSRRDVEERATAAQVRFVGMATTAGLTAEGQTISGPEASVAERVVALTRIRDLSIIEQRDSDCPKPADILISRLLLESGRPTLIVPYFQKRPAEFDHVTVAWDGSATAARALADSLPFLQQASSVDVLSIETGRVPDDNIRDERIVRHLARHGIDALVRTISSTLSVADALLSHISDNGSGLLVMGAYGHSRLREAVLGGVSRDVLRTMTVPVLMSH